MSGTFGEILETKLSGESFRESYRDQCNVCLKTMHIAESIEKNPELKDELVYELNLDEEYLDSFLDAECCDYEATFKICEYLGVEADNVCGKQSSL